MFRYDNMAERGNGPSPEYKINRAFLLQYFFRNWLLNYDYEIQNYENNSIIDAISHVMKLLVNVVRYLLGIFALFQAKLKKS